MTQKMFYDFIIGFMKRNGDLYAIFRNWVKIITNPRTCKCGSAAATSGSDHREYISPGRYLYTLTFIISLHFFHIEAGVSLGSWFADLKGESTGHTTCQFLNLPVSAVQLSRGMASTVALMDATDLPLYPAGSALANRNKFAFTHLEWIMGLRKEYAGALFPIRDVGTVGLYSQIFTPGAFSNARDINENQSTVDMLEFAGGLTFASSFFKQKLSYGIGVSLIESRIDDVSAGAVSFSGNILYTPLPRLSIQCNAANLGTDIVYVSTKEKLPARAGFSLRVIPLSQHNPFTSKFSFDISAGVAKIADEPLTAGISSELTLIDYVKFRAGYDYTYGEKPGLTGLSIGTGFHFGMYGLDCSWKNQSQDLGSVWAATLKLQMEEIEPLTAEDYYQAGMRYYQNKRMKLSTIFARKALRLDPSMWKAHSLLAMIRSQQLREKNLEIGMVYIGNIKGLFTIPYDPVSFGGLSRIISVVNTLRSQFNVFFALESGNLVTSGAHQSRIKLAARTLDYAKFDAIAAGSQELILGADKLSQAAENKRIRFIKSSADITDPYTHNQIIESNGYRFYVASFISGTSAPAGLKQHLKAFNEEELLTNQASDCHLRILIIDDNWENIRKIAAQLKQFDLIICNNCNQHFPSPIQVGRVKIFSAGANGAFAGLVTMRFNESKQLVSIDNRLIPMNSEIKPDPYIDSLVSAISAEIELADQGIDSIAMSRATTDGSFIFLSDRDSTTGIYLKNTRRLAEFPLSRTTGADCDNPAFSFSSGKVVFRQKRSSCYSLEIMDISGALKHTLKDSLSTKDITFSTKGDWAFLSAAPCEEKNTDIFKIRFDGGRPVPVITWKESSEYGVNISYDNTTIAFCSDRDQTAQIYVCGTDGSQPIRITDSSAQHSLPRYSPTKKYLAYLSDNGNYSGRMDLWVYDQMRGVHRQITSNSNVKDYCWLSDGVTIIYSSGVNILDLNKVDIETFRFSKLVADHGLKTHNDYSPQLLNMDGIEHIIFVREEIDGSKKIMMADTDGSEVKIIVDGKGNDWLP